MKQSRSNLFCKLLCLCMALCMLFTLTACDGGNTPGGGETPGGETPGGETPGGETPGGDTPGDETPGGNESEPPAAVSGTGLTGIPADANAAYAPIAIGDLAGGACAVDATGFDGGAKLDEATFPYLGREGGESVEVTAANVVSMLRTGGFAGKVYRLAGTDPVVIDGATNRTYEGNGAVLLTSVPLQIKNGNGITFQDITIINVAGGPAMTFASTSTITLRGVEAVGGTGITMDASVEDVTISSSRILATGDGLAIESVATATIYDSVIVAGGTGLSAGGTDVFVENCLINAPAGGVAITADDSRVWYSTVRGDIKAEGTTNLLVAENHIYGTPVSVKVTGAHNSVVLLNRMMGATVEESTSIFVADNAMGYDLAASSVNYLLGNNNTLGEKAAVRLSAVTNQSGNTLNDVDARLEVGANEDLLPKQNKDAFVGMTRKETVRERDLASDRPIHMYLEEEAKRTTTVILAPGAYSYTGVIHFRTGTLPNTTVYAYGTLAERADYHNSNISVSDTKNLTIKGIATGHPMNSSGNTIVVAKREGKYIDVIAGAGMVKDWTDSSYYNFSGLSGGIYGYRYGHNEPYADMGFQQIVGYNAQTGIITMALSASTYNLIEVGDSITCRGGNGAVAIAVVRSETPTFEDVTVYGAGGFAFNDSLNTGKSLTLHRVWVTTAAAPVITEEEYNTYLGYEEQYGVDFGVMIDDNGYYRGSPHRMSSIDATHSSHCKEGIKLTSCLFETMCDDGTNQCSAHCRLFDVKDLGDGTLKLTYMTTLSRVAYNVNGSRSGGMACQPFAVGDPLYMYTSKGQVICNNSPVLSASKNEPAFTNEFGGTHQSWSITVKKDDVNLAAIEGLELKRGTPFEDYVAVDNHAWSSDGYVIDNCLIRDMRSRCLLLQSSNGIVKNCSLTGSGMSAVLIWHDMDWGESGISANIKVQNNYIENNGHYGDNIIWTPIYVMGLGETVQDDFFTQVNIEISGNHIVDYNTTYAIALDSVREAKIVNNTFSARKGYSAEESIAMRLFAVKDIEIAGNTFASPDVIAEDVIRPERFKNIYGKDVEFDGLPLFVDDVE